MSETPSAPSAQVAAPRELTWRAIALGAAITVLFTAANVYLGLKIGITFATSIPAAVISMAVLRHLPGVSIQENNIVQTIASAAGTLSAIIFVLPGLVMIGWWRGFAFGPSVAIIALGGVLGVMLSVPLRRALLDDPALPFPEGVAAAEVLKLGDDSAGSEDNARGLRAIVGGAAVSAGYALLAKLGVVAEEVSRFVRLGAGGTSLSASLSLALIGVGHLVGLAVGLAMLAGLVIGWLVLLPHYTAMGPPPGVEWADFVATTFRHKVRFVGAGTMGVAAIWTLLRVIGPVARGLSGALAAQRLRRAGQGHTLPLAERDVPIVLVGLAIALALVP
ncbi:MAG TPA: oligopeptide transporter, OPT family, partial [Novosphingobium sp.]|nr:oligopeptide transporter, OPT family [Novosphingobium sp.]